MFNFVLVIHLVIVVLMIGLVLLQKSETGGLVSSSNMGGFMSVRGSANFMTRTTAILAGLFFLTSLTLVWLTASTRSSTKSVFDNDPLAVKTTQQSTATVPTESSPLASPQSSQESAAIQDANAPAVTKNEPAEKPAQKAVAKGKKN